MPTTYPFGTLLLDNNGNAYRARHIYNTISGEPGAQSFSVLDNEGYNRAIDSELLPENVKVIWRPNPVMAKLLEAGIVYPANWDEMGSSEKDLWEDSALATLEKRKARK